MANLVNRARKQDAVLWLFVREDEFGQKVYEPPRQIKVRWEEKTEAFLSPLNPSKGETELSHAQVFVGEKIPERSVLWKGRLTDLSDYEDPFNQNDPDDPAKRRPAYEVRQYAEQPNMKANPNKTLRYCML